MKRYLVGCIVVLLSVCVSPLRSVSQPLDEEVLEVKIKGVTIDPEGNTPVVILEEQQGHRAFPIWIGIPEARAIMLEMEGVPTPRPLTHVLLHNILVNLNVKVGRVIITAMQEDTFYATILLRQGNKTLTVDARPSDALALALHAHAPVFATKKLLNAMPTVTLQAPPSPTSVVKALGMHLQNLDATLASFFHLAQAGGVLVSSVEAGSQAEQHGMRRGDVITSIDGKLVKDIQDFLAAYKGKKVGQAMLCQVTRDRNPLTIRLVRSSRDEERKR